MRDYGLVADTIYPVVPIKVKRPTVRAILVNGANEIALMHVVCEDQFGKRDHYELPGGGIEKGESKRMAVIREISEETGWDITNIKFVGKMAITYHLLARTDIGYFYLAKAVRAHEQHFTTAEKQLFSEMVWLPLANIEAIYADYPVQNVGKMIHQRDLTMILAAIQLKKGEK